jgi:hypothetical protein
MGNKNRIIGLLALVLGMLSESYHPNVSGQAEFTSPIEGVL